MRKRLLLTASIACLATAFISVWLLRPGALVPDPLLSEPPQVDPSLLVIDDRAEFIAATPIEPDVVPAIGPGQPYSLDDPNYVPEAMQQGYLIAPARDTFE